MASNQVVVQVTPQGHEWHVTVGESPLLTLQSKETAVAEAVVQAIAAQPSRVVVHGVDGKVEEEVSYPPERAEEAPVAEPATEVA